VIKLLISIIACKMTKEAEKSNDKDIQKPIEEKKTLLDVDVIRKLCSVLALKNISKNKID